MSDSTGCPGSTALPAAINIYPNPVITFAPAEPLVCRGSSLPIQAGGGTLYSWSPARGLSNDAVASPVASPDSTTLYTVHVTDDIGCENTRPVTVTVVQKEKIRVNADTSVCAGGSLQLHASGTDAYNWINTTDGLNNLQIPEPVARPVLDIVYTVTGTDAHQCFSDTARVAVQVLPLPVVDAGQDVEAMAGTKVPLNALASADVIQYRWSPASYLNCSTCPSPVSTPVAQITYTVTVKNRVGCFAADSMTIKMQCDENRVSIPNIFTPNTDGKNDVFAIKGISIIKHLVIFNRWGEKVFERNNFIAADRASCWDGTYKGYPAPEGTYVYFVEMQCSGGGVFTRNGTVILLR